MNDAIYSLKKHQLSELAAYRDHLRKHPELKWLFFELTNACNLHCAHCGSHCKSKGEVLSLNSIDKTLLTIPTEAKPIVCLTGGEPLLHPDFFIIAKHIAELGFEWGMTSNGTLIDYAVAHRLHQCSMGTVSISLDGLEVSHDRFRKKKGAWEKAVEGIRHLQEVGFSPQVTTVVHADNINELGQLYEFLCNLDIDSWRIINVEPIGRACEAHRILLSSEQFTTLLHFIQAKRYDLSCPMEVTYGCSHYLGIELERMVRNNYFLCGAGIYVASIRSNGDICACLDIKNIPSLVQGNIITDNFWNVWCQQFHVFRIDRTENSSTCVDCEDRWICGGDSAHTWNWETDEPLLCGKKAIIQELHS